MLLEKLPPIMKKEEKKRKKKTRHVENSSLSLEDSMIADKSDDGVEETMDSANTEKVHTKELKRLRHKDPEFYDYLKEHDEELLKFNDDGTDGDDSENEAIDTGSLDEDIDYDSEASTGDVRQKVKLQQTPAKHITSEMIDLWCEGIKKHEKFAAIRSLLQAFRIACHHGDDGENRFTIISSSVFNKVMLFVLNEMDGILRGLIKFPLSGGKKETVLELTTTIVWKKYGHLVRLYLGNTLHVLNQMTDEQMIAFTLKRIKDSAVFLAAFPVLLRKYLKVVLHFWSIGGSSLQVVSFLFLRNVCVRLGSDCLDTCLKGIYKAYVLICKIKGKYASVSKLKQVRFLGNCVTELYGIDLPISYQHAFSSIRQLAIVLRNALSEKPKGKKEDVLKGKRGSKKQEGSSKNKKEAYLKVYDWQFINCLELWTNVICTYNSDADIHHLAYPLTQIIFGVARLVPTARYLPIRLQCARMLNRIGFSTSMFLPVSALLLDVLEFKELSEPPVGPGKGVDLLTRKLVGKPTLKTRAFQEACILSIVDLLAEHFAQWSYSVCFFELSFITIVRLRNFCKIARIDLFRKEVKELIRQVEANSIFTNAKRSILEYGPSDPCVDSFLKAEKESQSSPLSQFSANLKKRTQQRSNVLLNSSVVVGEQSFRNKPSSDREEDGNIDDDVSDDNVNSEEGNSAFSSSWLPDPKVGLAKIKRGKEQHHQEIKEEKQDFLEEEDVVEDLILSSDDDELLSSSASEDEKDDDDKEGVVKVKKKRHRPPTKKKKSKKNLKKKIKMNE
ncbi:Nucleolar complex protein-like protein [Zostera marina]|uniref:Nucleolar complex protein-like protein n=1 Tax=Zostera marina TaxID=29655 RepID=A0A0K9P4S3_ZOSMR|nr:Nucleolar complex protein-like protein [Zostera marina]